MGRSGYNRNIFKTSLYIYIFQDEKCRLMRNLSLSVAISLSNFLDILDSCLYLKCNLDLVKLIKK